MVTIIDKSKCCGCEACVQICPKSCIAFNEDNEGFRYPKVNADECIDCGLCEKVCPVINVDDKREPLLCSAALNTDFKERIESSSGGIFILLAKEVIKQGGIVFGVRFDNNWEVIHTYSDTNEGLVPFMGSKYVQSRIGGTFVKAREFLNQGYKVLFSGTPCQIAGLRKYLRKDYENLITVDIICHGVPSPAVWREYLEEIKRSTGKREFNRISFRDKKCGWRNFNVSFTLSQNETEAINNVTISKPHAEEPYFLGFNTYNLFLRPSCMHCPTRDLRSGSDITLADFWGIETLLPGIDDDKGISLVLSNTEKGLNIFQTLSVKRHDVAYSEVLERNHSIAVNSKPQVPSIRERLIYRRKFQTKRDYFFYDTKRSVVKKIRLLCRPSLFQKIRRILSRIKRMI